MQYAVRPDNRALS